LRETALTFRSSVTFSTLDASWCIAMIVSILILSAIAQASAPYIVVKGATRTLQLEEEAGDLLVVDGKVDIAGVVRGHVFAIDSEVTVRSTAVVLQSIAVHRGSIHVEDGAVLPETITLKDAKLIGREGELRAKDGEKAAIGRAGTTIAIDGTVLSTASVALMKSVLPFERFSPDNGASIDQLVEWTPGLGLQKKMESVAPQQMTIGGITKLSFVSGKARGAMQNGFRGARGTVLFSVIELEDEAAAKALWAEVERAGSAAKVSLSVKTGLGGGAHWFFKKKGRYVMLWQQGTWFFAVETKLASDEATLYQEKQFTDQVLTGLRQDLSQHQGATR
jgi:hypothetical protein